MTATGGSPIIAVTNGNTRLSAPRFLADAMLGRLARWLRVLGMDTAYDPSVPDPQLVSWARAEQRILLTRDRTLVVELRPLRALLVEPDAPLLQLRQVVAQVGVAPPVELFTRCLVCNAELHAASAEDIDARIPAASRALPGPVRRCPICGRVYWPGSHARRMRAALARTLPEWFRCLTVVHDRLAAAIERGVWDLAPDPQARKRILAGNAKLFSAD